MCLILLGFQADPNIPLVVAANRDEYYQRPTAAAHFWASDPDLLAGRDLQSGGTWLGLTKSGRFAAITNYRSGPRLPSQGPSRGELPAEFLRGDMTASAYAKQIMNRAKNYNGFNLLIADQQSLFYCNNITMESRQLSAGIYGLSNHVLDTDWPKVQKGKQALRDWLDANEKQPEQLLAVLGDKEIAPDVELPSTGVPLETERLLSPMFITSADYGTCCSTAIIIDGKDQVQFHERSYYNDLPSDKRDVAFQFSLQK